MIGNNILIGADFVAHLMEDVIVHRITVRSPCYTAAYPQHRQDRACRYLHAQTRDGRLCVSLWWGLAGSAPPLTMQVERSDPPCCTVKMADSADLDETAAAGELQRSIAWAWLID